MKLYSLLCCSLAFVWHTNSIPAAAANYTVKSYFPDNWQEQEAAALKKQDAAIALNNHDQVIARLATQQQHPITGLEFHQYTDPATKRPLPFYDLKATLANNDFISWTLPSCTLSRKGKNPKPLFPTEQPALKPTYIKATTLNGLYSAATTIDGRAIQVVMYPTHKPIEEQMAEVQAAQEKQRIIAEYERIKQAQLTMQAAAAAKPEPCAAAAQK